MGSASKNGFLAPRPLAVAGQFIYDEHNGGGRRRKQRHKSRIESEAQHLNIESNWQDESDQLRRKLLQLNDQ